MSTGHAQTVTIKVKYLWLIFAIFLILLATAPAVYYVNGLYAPNQNTPPPPVIPSGPTTSATGTGTQTSSGPVTVTIVIQNSIFGTGAQANNPVTVAPGTTVIWVNHDGTTHTSTSNTGLWSSPILSPGQSFKFTFNTPGTYDYHCEIHPMAGVIIVS